MRSSRKSSIVTLVLLIGTLLVRGPAAFAVHDLGIFELDGDALNSAAAGDDWDSLFPTDTSSSEIAKVFVNDGIDPPADTTYFTGGGSKDVNDVNQWQYTGLDQAPDKDEISNAYAAAYVSGGDLLVYFGADRFANNGDSQIGFWFFQNAVGLAPGGTFTGVHAVGDILVLSDFLKGGSVSSIKVYEWVGSGGSDGPLDLLVTGKDCLGTVGPDLVCATVNAADTPAPWPYTPKFGAAGTFPTGSFYEGGINVTQLLPNQNECFSSFMAETRSSQSPTAQLKDFALGNFNLCATKSGQKFEDLNANGAKDAGEPGLPGWEIHLFGTDVNANAVHLHTTTDASGNYSFGGVKPGTYTVCETQQAGWSQSYPGTGAGTADCSGHGGGRGYAITLTFGQVDSGNDFGNFQPATKTGMKFEDRNANGVKDAGEPGLAGWEIHLFGTDGAGAAVHVHATTDASGNYSFTGLRPGSYTVCETIQPGWTQSFPSSATAPSCSSHGGGLGYTVNLTSGQTDSGNDFGNFRLATKTGMKFEDRNDNGAKDAGEPGLSGWEIHLFGTNGAGGAVHQHAVTGAGGTYSFSVLPGTYTVCETQQAGWSQSYPGTGAGTADCSAHGGGSGYAINLTSGQIDSDNDFGNFRLATKNGMKFEDTDADGVKDAGEPGLSGWEIHLFGASGAGAAVHVHATTGPGGGYTFQVPPGTYTVCETVQVGWVQSFPTSGADCSSHGGGKGYAVTFVSGDVDSGNDFGNYQSATKTGAKFNDLNANGVKDASEPGLSGWQIHLFGTDGAGAAVHVHTTTGADGTYTFNGLRPGSYTVCETQQGGWTQSFPTSGADCSAHGGGLGYAITLTSGQTDSGNDFGNFQPATKTGVKFEDRDADGVKDAGEPGLSGWQIHLFGVDGAGTQVHVHAATNASGTYTFGGLRPGSYTVCETIQAGWTQSFPTSGADCSSHGGGLGYAITLASGQTDSGNDFGNYRNATKSGAKFNDLDADGVRDAGEPGLANWEIHLFGTSGSGAAVHQHAMTDLNGNYSFDVPPGSYTVCETVQPAWQQSFPTSGADCSTHGGGTGYAIVLTSGQVETGNDFGNFRLTTKTGVKFEDLDADGVRDAGEPGLPGWQIHLFGTDGTGAAVHEHATTDASGTYIFMNLKPGSYTVCEQQQGGWTQSFPTSGADCSGHGGGVGYAITLTSGQLDSGNDFGNFRNATKSGAKFEDANGNGVLDAGEPGLAGWQIHLFGTSGSGAAVHLHTTTAADGSYSFNLAPGNYTVCEQQQAGWTQSFPGTGADCSAHGGGTGYAITLVSGENEANNNFGNFRNATKTGVKFEDADADGARDAGEPGLAGWQIHLFGTSGAGAAVHLHTTTAADGSYSFNVAPGVYTVCETMQTGWTQAFPGTGADCSGHGGGVGYAITLTSGQTDSGNDFGNFRSGTKTGVKFEDLDADGVKDAGEPGLAGWEIHIFGASGSGAAIHQHTTTGAGGAYSFDVPPGVYTVCETAQAGWSQSFPTAGADCSGHGGGRGYSITLTSGSLDSNNDFGNFRNATKTGAKFEDTNANGVRNTGEPGLAGWEIHIFGASGSGAAVHQHTTTGADGTYTLSVPPGTYTVCETVQAGWSQSFPTSGASCTAHGGGLGYAITLTSGQVDSGNDFGNFRSGTKTGVKFNDLNENGVRDAGEPVLAGWEIHIFGTGGTGAAIHQHAVTDATGAYSFSVPPGTYTVCETQKSGWAQSFPASGADCSGHTHGGTLTPAPFGYAITLGSGGLDSNNDFGNFLIPIVLPARIEAVEVLPLQVLPVTGIDAVPMAMLGIGLLLVGTALLAASRQHETQPGPAAAGTILPNRRRKSRGPPRRPRRRAGR